ncbi:hypothetical protein B0T16DRAFT_392127 [Cercophora newfieldiana]|uniref:Uncharacterized protein n=1 Tax=Cercophora newfieldiana TaxID=92897 RepID=A0AA39Y0B3_9PEZI|nr:hypothetical protein B0T16DRAFT_392127 [Cercophora newfieldiana]
MPARFCPARWLDVVCLGCGRTATVTDCLLQLRNFRGRNSPTQRSESARARSLRITYQLTGVDRAPDRRTAHSLTRRFDMEFGCEQNATRKSPHSTLRAFGLAQHTATPAPDKVIAPHITIPSPANQKIQLR